MATEVVVPMLGITNEKGKILKWLKSEGDFVTKGESIFEIETDKVVTEVESPATGILKKILIPENTEVPILTVVAIITERDEELPERYRPGKIEIPPSPTPSMPERGEIKKVSTPPLKRSEERYDIAILGAGPGGYVAAARAAQMGAEVLLIEKAELGGNLCKLGMYPY